MPTESQSNDHIQAWPASALAGLRERVEQAERERDTAVAQRDAALSENEDLEDIVLQQAELCRSAVVMLIDVAIPAFSSMVRTYRPDPNDPPASLRRDTYQIATDARGRIYALLMQHTRRHE